MTSPTVVRSAKARRDIRELYTWIVEDSGLSRAEMIVDRFETALRRLARRPLMGRLRSDFEGGPRSFSVGPWLIVYEPLQDESGIHLLRIIDSRRDVAALLGKKS
ncbi:type II toxin-antitoxin system RelE/ParE family toxin [Caulobacter sp. Root1455]|uniref:type II toxin-antitoxin system RelE/ParE family toxin n=1 Tax=Caulobacter sp. Root1455 TaxID=1736465 RepID=UPI0009E8A8B2|nr:type II toxin-antitoxin system RelE/ParE family toxin [Caulobacter sp. Root1455]